MIDYGTPATRSLAKARGLYTGAQFVEASIGGRQINRGRIIS